MILTQKDFITGLKTSLAMAGIIFFTNFLGLVMNSQIPWDYALVRAFDFAFYVTWLPSVIFWWALCRFSVWLQVRKYVKQIRG